VSSKGKFTSTNQPGKRLTPEEVAECRKLRAEGWSQPRLSRKFKRSLNAIYQLLNGLTYNDIAIIGTDPRLADESDIAASAARLAGFQQLVDQSKSPPEVDVTALMKELEEPKPTRELLPDEIWDEHSGVIRKRTPYD